MLRRIALALTGTILAANLAFAAPAVRVDLDFGTPRVVLEGNWAGASYNVFRSASAGGEFVPVLSQFALCTGECFAFDPDADLGASYYYRFDVLPAAGGLLSFGPTLVHIGPRVEPGLHMAVWPNPVRGPARVRLAAARPSLPGEAAVVATGERAEAALYDLRGRRVRRLFLGTLDRVIEDIAWDGRDDAGRALAPGTYFLRFSSASRRPATTRVTVVR